MIEVRLSVIISNHTLYFTIISHHNIHARFILYHNLCVRLIRYTSVFHSEHNCLVYHNISILYKTWYKNPNLDSDYFFNCQLQQFNVFTGIGNPAITRIPIFIIPCLYIEYFPSYFCDILYSYDIGHSLAGSKKFSLWLSSDMNFRA